MEKTQWLMRTNGTLTMSASMGTLAPVDTSTYGRVSAPKVAKTVRANQWVLPDHVERTLSRKDFHAIKRYMDGGGIILNCALLYEAQPMQVAYAMRTNTYAEYLTCQKEMAEPKKKRALTVSNF